MINKTINNEIKENKRKTLKLLLLQSIHFITNILLIFLYVILRSL